MVQRGGLAQLAFPSQRFGGRVSCRRVVCVLEQKETQDKAAHEPAFVVYCRAHGSHGQASIHWYDSSLVIGPACGTLEPRRRDVRTNHETKIRFDSAEVEERTCGPQIIRSSVS